MPAPSGPSSGRDAAEHGSSERPEPAERPEPVESTDAPTRTSRDDEAAATADDRAGEPAEDRAADTGRADTSDEANAQDEMPVAPDEPADAQPSPDTTDGEPASDHAAPAPVVVSPPAPIPVTTERPVNADVARRATPVEGEQVAREAAPDRVAPVAVQAAAETAVNDDGVPTHDRRSAGERHGEATPQFATRSAEPTPTETQSTTARPAAPKPGTGDAAPVTTAAHRAVDAATAPTEEPVEQAPRRDRTRVATTTIPTISAGEPVAAARAEQVDQAVRLEQATNGQSNAAAGLRTAATATRAESTVSTGVRESTPPPSPAGPNGIDHQKFTGRVLRGLSTMVNQRGGVMSMRLDPPELGQLRVQMSMARGTVAARFEASTPQAQMILEKSMTVLRTALEGHGLTVERLSVHLQSGSNQAGAEGQTQGHEKHDAGGHESRGRFAGREHADASDDARAAEFTRLIDELATTATGASS